VRAQVGGAEKRIVRTRLLGWLLITEAVLVVLFFSLLVAAAIYAAHALRETLGLRWQVDWRKVVGLVAEAALMIGIFAWPGIALLRARTAERVGTAARVIGWVAFIANCLGIALLVLPMLDPGSYPAVATLVVPVTLLLVITVPCLRFCGDDSALMLLGARSSMALAAPSSRLCDYTTRSAPRTIRRVRPPTRGPGFDGTWSKAAELRTRRAELEYAPKMVPGPHPGLDRPVGMAPVLRTRSPERSPLCTKCSPC
jgi:hypothetical protein